MREIQFEVNDEILSGTAVLDPIVMILTFHSVREMMEWKQGQPFRLIVRWIKEAKPPRYFK